MKIFIVMLFMFVGGLCVLSIYETFRLFLQYYKIRQELRRYIEKTDGRNE